MTSTPALPADDSARPELLDRVVMYLGSQRRAHGRHVVVDIQDDRYVLVPLWHHEMPDMHVLRDVRHSSIVEVHNDNGPVTWDQFEMDPGQRERIAWWAEYGSHYRRTR